MGQPNRDIWKAAQKNCEKLFRGFGCFVQSLKDTEAAGQLTANTNPGDYLVGKHGILFYVEVKSTISSDFTRSALGDQIPIQTNAASVGVPGAYYIEIGCGTKKHQKLLLSWYEVLMWYHDPRQRMPGALKFFGPTVNTWDSITTRIKGDQALFSYWIATTKTRSQLPKPKKGLIYKVEP